MQKFSKLLVLFSLPILIGMISLELVLRNIPNDYSNKRNYLDAKSNKIEALFLGNSHIYFGINPTYMNRKSYNEAHISQSLNIDLAILEKYKNDWKKLKYIIVPIDYFSLYTTLEEGAEKWRVKNYSIYYDISVNKNLWNNFEVFNSKFPANISRTKRYLLNHKTDITSDALGFGTTYNSKDSKDLIQTGNTAAKRHTVDMKNSMIFSKNIQIINSMIAFSKEKNIKIIFITCPGYTSYTKQLNPVQLNNTIKTIKQVVSNNSNAYYYNFLTDKTFVAADYFDADHLNEIGAKKFTLKIDDLLNTLEKKER